MTKLTPSEVLALVDRRDGTALNRYTRELALETWEEYLETTFGDQDFSSWDRYHTWLKDRWVKDSFLMRWSP